MFSSSVTADRDQGKGWKEGWREGGEGKGRQMWENATDSNAGQDSKKSNSKIQIGEIIPAKYSIKLKRRFREQKALDQRSWEKSDRKRGKGNSAAAGESPFARGTPTRKDPLITLCLTTTKFHPCVATEISITRSASCRQLLREIRAFVCK